MIYLLVISTGIFSVAVYPVLPRIDVYFLRLSSLSLIWLFVERFKIAYLSLKVLNFRRSMPHSAIMWFN